MEIRKAFSMMLAVFLLTSLFSVAVGSAGNELAARRISTVGVGTLDDPIMIEDVYDLQDMRNNLSAHYALANDIDASVTAEWNDGEGFIPIGDDGNRFTGSLDGGNHTISHLFMNRSTDNLVSLFGFIYEGKVGNLRMEDVDVTGYRDLTAGLVAANAGTVFNCHVTGRVSGHKSSGGIVAHNEGVVDQSSAHVDIFGLDYSGGLVGLNEGNITRSFSTGDILSYVRVGGLVGYNTGSVENSYSTGNVSGEDDIGGLVGYNHRGIIRYSHSVGLVQGVTGVGGLTGYVVTGGDYEDTGNFWDTDTSACDSSAMGTGKTTEEMMIRDTFANAGWDFEDIWYIEENITYPVLLWSVEKGTPDNPYLIYDVYDLQAMAHDTTAHYALANDIDASETREWNDGAGFDPIGWWVNVNDQGGFNGSFDGRGHTISGLYINRPEERYVGLFGVVTNGTVKNVGVLDVDITGDREVGALVGYNQGAILNSYATGVVEADRFIGGLVGENCAPPVGGDWDTVIRYSYAHVDVFGSNYVGGFAGRNNRGSVENSYSTGEVTRVSSFSDSVGGFLGDLGWYGVTINCYSTGRVRFANIADPVLTKGFLGSMIGNYQVLTGSFWDMETSGQFSSPGEGPGQLEGKTTVEMYNRSTFESEGWDFEDIWWIMNESYYPILRWQDDLIFDILSPSQGSIFNVPDVTIEWRGGNVVSNLDHYEIRLNLGEWEYLGMATEYTYHDLEPGVHTVEVRLTYDNKNRSAVENVTFEVIHGDGSPDNPYVIYNVWDLQNMTNDLEAHYILGNDIDAYVTSQWDDGAGFDPIGKHFAGADFRGSFDGRGHVIYGLHINRQQNMVGLFGKVGNWGAFEYVTISNVGLVDVNITGGEYVGGLVGYNSPENNLNITDAYVTGYVEGRNEVGLLMGRAHGTGHINNSHTVGTVVGGNYTGGLIGISNFAISNSYAHCDVHSDYSRVGGLVGHSYNLVENSHSSGTVTGYTFVGGLVGSNFSGDINDSHSDSHVVGVVERIGGLVGSDNRNNVFNSYSTGDVSGPSRVGGLIGESTLGSVSHSYFTGNVTGAASLGGLIGQGSTDIFNSFVSGTVTGTGSNVGSLVGYNNGGVVENSYTTGDVIGNNNVGGLVGRNDGGVVENSYTTGDVIGNNNVGGLVGFNFGGTVSNSHASVEVTGNERVGGLVGFNNGGTVNNSFSTGAVEGDTDAVGGLIGWNSGTIYGSHASGTVHGRDMVGGLIGRNEYSVLHFYSTGSVEGRDNIGGLVGINRVGSVTHSYATGSVTGNQYVGGLVGRNLDLGRPFAFVNYTYATGLVTGVSAVGGLVGHNGDTIRYSFWDTETTGMSVGVGSGDTTGAYGNHTMGMMTESTFLDMGWDFAQDWWMVDQMTRPFLRCEYNSTIRNANQLQMMAMDLTGDYNLGADIVFSTILDKSSMWGTNLESGGGFVPVGTGSQRFSGTFHGDGHTVTDLYINRPGTDNQGLFGHVGDNTGTTIIRDVGMVDAMVMGGRGTGTLIGRVTGNANTLIEICYAIGGSVTGDGETGGLIGAHNSHRATVGGTDNPLLRYSFSNVSVLFSGSGTGDRFGGLVGCSQKGTIYDSYSWSDVTVVNGERIGGLAGCIDHAGNITNSYSTGLVDVENCTLYAGLVGTVGGGVVINSFWDVITSQQGDSPGGVGLNTSQMKTLSTFTDAGWDFEDIWWIKEGITYPYLRWEPDPHPIPPSIILTSPVGGEVWHEGTLEYITWYTVIGDDPILYVDLYYSTDMGDTWNILATDLTDTGSYGWTLPNVHSTDCLVLAVARDIKGSTGEAMSDSAFEIIGIPPAPPQYLTVEHHGESVQPVFEDDVECGDPGYTRDISHADASTWNIRQHGSYSGFYSWDFGNGMFNKRGDTGMLSWLISPEIHIPGDADPEHGVQLTFWHWYDWGDTDLFDAGNVKVSTDGMDGPWVLIIPEGGYHGTVPSTYGNPLGGEEAWGGSSDWTLATFDLTAYIGETIHIRWDAGVEAYEGGYGAGWRVDDISVDALLYDGRDNLLIWNASTDDPATVSHYNVYRSSAPGGPWDETTLVSSVNADGSATYSYTDQGRGLADHIFWWYVVRTVGTNGREEGNNQSIRETVVPLEQSIRLSAGGPSQGWNFVSLRLGLTDHNISAVLAGIDGSYDRLMYYHAATGEWLTYVPGRADHYNTLHTWDTTMGVWIRMTGNATLLLEGTAAMDTDITLYPGWNMVGLPSGTAGNHGLPPEVSRIGYFDATLEYNIAYDSEPWNFVFEPGHGYWVYNSADHNVVWTVEY